MVFLFDGFSGAELLAQLEGLFERQHTGGAGAVEESGGSCADAELQGIAEVPFFVEAEEHAGAEGVAGSCGSGDVFGGDV